MCKKEWVKTEQKEKGLLSKLSEKCGQLMAPYNILRALPFPDNIVLSRLICEYNYAYRNGNCTCDNYFICEPDELAESLNLSVEGINVSIKRLEEKGFISSLIIVEPLHIAICEVEILKYFSEIDNRNPRKWDKDLKKIQEQEARNVNLDNFHCF